MGFSANTKQTTIIGHQPLRGLFSQGALLAYLVIVLITFILIPVFMFTWVRLPIPGFLTGPGMVLLNVFPDSAAFEKGLRPGDQLIRLDGVLMTNGADYQAALTKAGPSAQIEVRTASGKTLDLTLPLQPIPMDQHIGLIYVPFLVGFVYLANAVWTYAVRRQRRSGKLLVLFSTSVALLAGGLFDFVTGQRLILLWLAALVLTAGSAFSLGLLFPSEDPAAHRHPMVHLIFFGSSLILGLNSLLHLSGLLAPDGLFEAIRMQIGLAALGIAFTAVWTTFRRARTASSGERDQLRLAIFGAIISYGPLLLWLALAPMLQLSRFPSPFVVLPMVLFPAAIGYTIQRYRLQQTDYVLSRGMLYGSLSIIIAAGYALLVAGLSLIFGMFFAPFFPFASGLVLFVLALGFNPLRERMQRAIDTVFFRGENTFQDRLRTFSGALTRSVELAAILQTLRIYIEESLRPNAIHIFVYDPLPDQYATISGSSQRLTSELAFSANSTFIHFLANNRGPLILSQQTTVPLALTSEKNRLALLAAEVYLALPGRERMPGWIALGPRLSGEFYTAQELTYLESLCDQAALAIERAQVLVNMESRVRQMNVLARVAQGVNITLAMDDILELIYAQTTSVIASDEFHIMLYDHALETYQYVFYLEGDDRLNDFENKVIPHGRTLEQETIRQHRPIRTDNYNRECQRLLIDADRPGMHAYMCIPLNAGAETIGALSLGSRDARVQYTAEQQNLGQSIADQVAGAIVKARLLQETERRALQLTTLNEVTRQLTSTLELEPLLQNILQSAVDILACEAGSLLLVDETTDELVFRVVVSPVANDLLNRRLPSGVGVVGVSVKTRAPIIVNDVNRYPEWFSKTDKQTGFVTRTLLVIPLQVKDKVTGVIEVINKKDGAPFSQDDQDLLSAFAAQAAVAIANARLYTMTDQALAARVEELSVMQRIDRELNTSLEISAAMRITLEWALRQSGVQAGLIGTLTEKAVQVMAANGYTDELSFFQNGLIPLDHLALGEAVHEAAPLRRNVAQSSYDQRLLGTALSQTVIPIRRETTTIGILFLESNSPSQVSEDTLNFLIRLCDHASVAIFNSQLYAAVQSANLAKSEFVSFVAHELKNPMTSVKGYTELLAAGAVGSINEAQTNFLYTIRSNIERMNTLISDLNDFSKIEVGRLRLDFKAIPLADVVDSITRSTKRQVDEKQQKLSVELSKELPPAWADRTRLEQILVNLVSNAHKYTPASGQIWVSAEYAQNTWDPSGAPDVLHVWVKDNGLGISEEDQKKIFQKFFRSEDSKAREAPGTGLGLNITRSLVEMQGGRIWFESKFREGTTFHFTIPIAVA
jgi:signal transduction histidine kinase